MIYNKLIYLNCIQMVQDSAIAHKIEKKIDVVLGTEHQETMSGPKIIIQNHDQSVLGEFMADYNSSILEQAEAIGIDIGYSCRSGACYACACKVIQGSDQIDIGQYGIPLVDLEEDDILSCVAGLIPGEQVGDIILRKFY